jgi:D-3-phosphoglycerate dehydrogenase
LDRATKHLLSAERLRQCKPGVVVLNFARAGIVDDQALCAALDQGKVSAYGCDFPNGLIKGHERVIALPHIGASTREAEDNCAVMVADQVRDYLEDGNIRNSVNFPETSMPRGGCCRLTVANANVPNMVGQISTALARANLNISDMLNRSRGELAYTVIDVDAEIPEAVRDEVAGIEGVLAVRTIH